MEEPKVKIPFNNKDEKEEVLKLPIDFVVNLQNVLNVDISDVKGNMV